MKEKDSEEYLTVSKNSAPLCAMSDAVPCHLCKILAGIWWGVVDGKQSDWGNDMVMFGVTFLLVLIPGRGPGCRAPENATKAELESKIATAKHMAHSIGQLIYNGAAMDKSRSGFNLNAVKESDLSLILFIYF